jgi:hypothetical protein
MRFTGFGLSPLPLFLDFFGKTKYIMHNEEELCEVGSRNKAQNDLDNIISPEMQ